MAIKDAEIMTIVETIHEHYHNNINNRYVRKALLLMDISRTTWDHLESLTEKNDFFRVQGYQFDELYEQIIAAITFIQHAKSEVIPNIRTIIAAGSDTLLAKKAAKNNEDKVLREMAIKNFPSNLKIFADMIKKLYEKTIFLDKEVNRFHRPALEKYGELQSLIKSL